MSLARLKNVDGYNYYSIEILEKLGYPDPNQKMIDRIEELLKDFCVNERSFTPSKK